MDPRFADIRGITQEEVEREFTEEIGFSHAGTVLRDGGQECPGTGIGKRPVKVGASSMRGKEM